MQSVLLEFPWCENKLSQLSSSLLYIRTHLCTWNILNYIDMAADICFKSLNTSLIWAKILVHKISRICQEQIGRPRCSNHISEEMALPGWAFHLVPISVTGSLHFSQPCDRVSCRWQLFSVYLFCCKQKQSWFCQTGTFSTKTPIQKWYCIPSMPVKKVSNNCWYLHKTQMCLGLYVNSSVVVLTLNSLGAFWDMIPSVAVICAAAVDFLCWSYPAFWVADLRDRPVVCISYKLYLLMHHRSLKGAFEMSLM